MSFASRYSIVTFILIMLNGIYLDLPGTMLAGLAVCAAISCLRTVADELRDLYDARKARRRSAHSAARHSSGSSASD